MRAFPSPSASEAFHGIPRLALGLGDARACQEPEPPSEGGGHQYPRLSALGASGNASRAKKTEALNPRAVAG